jgi:hypothetical protein
MIANKLPREHFVGRFLMKNLFFGGCFCISALVVTDRANSQSADDWPFYGYDAGSTRFSPLRQIASR